jgi:hydrogenase maturation protein HypF
LNLPVAARPLLAVGAELKNTFCLASRQHAFMSQHIGDMKDLDTLEAFERITTHMKKLFRVEPELIVCDPHPSYLSTYWAEEYVESHKNTQLVRVQHHHAHIASLMAESGLPDEMPVIGFSFDGTGYGSDGAIWGGEVLLANYRRFDRVAHLKYFSLPGGDAAIRQPYRVALAALQAAGIEWDELLPPVATTTAQEREVLERQLATNLNCVPTSSMGRLFDVVATLAGVRQTISYEAQAAIELEGLVDLDCCESYHFDLPTPSQPWFDAAPVLRAVVEDALNHRPPSTIATRFHNAVSNLILAMSLNLRSHTGVNTVGLSGGVFQNLALLRPTVRRLQSAGFEVLVHSIVPPNDGGLALGQAAVAAAQTRDS